MSRRIAIPLALALGLAGCVGNQTDRPGGERPPAQGAGYVVRAGDTLLAIASRTGVDMGALARANRLRPPYLIRVGQRLVVPPREPGRPAAVAATRPVVPPPPRPSPPPSPPPRAFPPVGPAPVPMGAPRLVWPADGPVSESFRAGAGSGGIAIAAHPGAAVRAAAAGTVTFAGDGPPGTGRLVRIDHGGGWVTVYRNVGRTVIAYGERIASGARVGFVGVSAAGSQAALGFELRGNEVPVDPLPLLPPRF